jgi:hypothetical protein
MLIAGLIASLVGVFANIGKNGIKVVGVTVVIFICCFFMGTVFFNLTRKIQNSVWRWVIIMLGLLLPLFVLGRYFWK